MTRRDMPPRGYVRVQWALKGQRGNARVTIPAALARQIGPERLFRVEVVEEGILLRYVEGGNALPAENLPEWLR